MGQHIPSSAIAGSMYTKNISPITGEKTAAAAFSPPHSTGSASKPRLKEKVLSRFPIQPHTKRRCCKGVS